MPRKQKKYHYIYKTTCNVNKKYYIGMHSTDNLDDGYIGSGKRLWNSIKYHGKENFTKEIIEFCDNRVQLKKREKEIVNEQLLNEELCMNLQTGGGGGFSGKEHREKFIQSAKKGREMANKILKERYGGDENWISKFNSDVSKKAWENPEYRKKILKAINWTGRKHKEESKRKIGDANRIHQKGEKNSQYGTCWITKGGENKKIKKDDLTQWETKGWVKGRKIK